jgi:phage replication O-like protein O
MSEQKEDKNYTKIPNIVFDYWLGALSLAQFKVFLCICRKLYGWHKTQDKISISQIMKMTGLGNKAVIRIINELILIGLIVKIKSKETCGDDACNLFYIDIEVMNMGSVLKTLPSVPKTQGVVSQKHYPVVSQRHKGVVSQRHTQKKDKTKENYKETTTTTKEGVVVVVPFAENLALASRMHEFMADEVEKRRWPQDWKLSIDIFACLIEKHGREYVSEQLNYMVQQQIKHLKSRKGNPINDPATYLRKAAEENWASSIKQKEKT